MRSGVVRIAGFLTVLGAVGVLLLLGAVIFNGTVNAFSSSQAADVGGKALLQQGKRVFRFDTFGDQAFWGGALQLHRAIEGSANGGVGPGVSPKTALAVGLKVDAVRALCARLRIKMESPAPPRAYETLKSPHGGHGNALRDAMPDGLDP